MNYIYVLSGWEGSADDNRVLRDAITRENGLKINTDVDPMEDEVPDLCGDVKGDNSVGEDFIDGVDSSQAWTSWRDNLVMQMYSANA
ncbi:hypothetical protein ACS0TY_029914 [Phlomoides rotata]